MLRQRIITAVVLAALLLGSLYSGAEVLLALLLGAFVCLAAWEWAGLTGSNETRSKALYALFATVPLFGVYACISTPWITALVWLGTVWWCIAAAMVFCYQAGVGMVPATGPLAWVMGYFVFYPAWTALVGLFPQPHGLRLLLLFFVMICLVDSMAFFAGRRWGKKKLAMRVSPGKTWVGCIAGVAVSLLPGLIYVAYEDISGFAGIWLILLCMLSAAFSVIGDLFISMFKRHANVKDTGHVLPGHGGVLDRIDGITAAAPVFTTGILMLEGRI